MQSIKEKVTLLCQEVEAHSRALLKCATQSIRIDIEDIPADTVSATVQSLCHRYQYNRMKNLALGAGSYVAGYGTEDDFLRYILQMQDELDRMLKESVPFTLLHPGNETVVRAEAAGLILLKTWLEARLAHYKAGDMLRQILEMRMQERGVMA